MSPALDAANRLRLRAIETDDPILHAAADLEMARIMRAEETERADLHAGAVEILRRAGR